MSEATDLAAVCCCRHDHAHYRAGRDDHRCCRRREADDDFCSPVARDPRCPDCGRDGRYRDTVTRPLTDLPVVGYPLVLQVAVPRYRCLTPGCGRAVFNQDLGKLAAPRSSTTRRCARYVLRRLMIDRTTIAAIAAELGLFWHTVSSIAMRTVTELITAAGPDRLTGVRVIGVDEHAGRPDAWARRDSSR